MHIIIFCSKSSNGISMSKVNTILIFSIIYFCSKHIFVISSFILKEKLVTMFVLFDDNRILHHLSLRQILLLHTRIHNHCFSEVRHNGKFPVNGWLEYFWGLLMVYLIRWTIF